MARLRLTTPEANHLGKEEKKDNQYSLTDEETRSVYIFRGYDEALVNECIEQGITPNKVKRYWHKSEHFSLDVRETIEGEQNTFKEDLLRELKEYSPTFPKIKRVKSIFCKNRLVSNRNNSRGNSQTLRGALT